MRTVSDRPGSDTVLIIPLSDGDRQTGFKPFAMKFSPENVYHIYNQGNNHQKIFSCDEEYEIFLNFVRANISSHCEVINWCLMPNHFHFMVYTMKECSILRNRADWK